MTTTTYRIAPAPKFAGQRDWTCVECGHEALKRPVFLTDGQTLIAVGTGCAAVLLFGRKDDQTIRQVRRDADAAQAAETAAEALRAERRARYTIALAAWTADDAGAPEVRSAVQTYRRYGGAAVLGTFPEFLARVAETGDLPEEVAA